MLYTLSARTSYTEFTNYCCRLLINLDFCFEACALCVCLVQKHRLQDVYATVLWHCQSAADQSCPILCYDFYKKHHNYVTPQGIFNRFCQNHNTFS